MSEKSLIFRFNLRMLIFANSTKTFILFFYTGFFMCCFREISNSQSENSATIKTKVLKNLVNLCENEFRKFYKKNVFKLINLVWFHQTRWLLTEYREIRSSQNRYSIPTICIIERSGGLAKHTKGKHTRGRGNIHVCFIHKDPFGII